MNVGCFHSGCSIAVRHNLRLAFGKSSRARLLRGRSFRRAPLPVAEFAEMRKYNKSGVCNFVRGLIDDDDRMLHIRVRVSCTGETAHGPPLWILRDAIVTMPSADR